VQLIQHRAGAPGREAETGPAPKSEKTVSAPRWSGSASGITNYGYRRQILGNILRGYRRSCLLRPQVLNLIPGDVAKRSVAEINIWGPCTEKICTAIAASASLWDVKKRVKNASVRNAYQKEDGNGL